MAVFNHPIHHAPSKTEPIGPRSNIISVSLTLYFQNVSAFRPNFFSGKQNGFFENFKSLEKEGRNVMEIIRSVSLALVFSLAMP